MTDSPTKPEGDALKIFSEPDLPRTFANGFHVVMSNADVAILLLQNGFPVSAVNMSYTVAKTLSQKIAGMIDKLEKKSGQPIMTTDDVAKYLRDEDDEPRLS